MTFRHAFSPCRSVSCDLEDGLGVKPQPAAAALSANFFVREWGRKQPPHGGMHIRNNRVKQHSRPARNGKHVAQLLVARGQRSERSTAVRSLDLYWHRYDVLPVCCGCCFKQTPGPAWSPAWGLSS